MDGTRVEILNDITSMLLAPLDLHARIIAVCGMAGSGKSTIAKTVAALLDHQGRLAASFFFSREYDERKRTSAVPATLAVQLAEYNIEFFNLLVTTLEDDRKQLHKAESQLQFQKLFVELLARLPASDKPIVIVLDALDECDTDHGALLLTWLSNHIKQIPVHIRFLITGRPEASITSHLESEPLLSVAHVLRLENINDDIVHKDIVKYLGQSLDGQKWHIKVKWVASSEDVEALAIMADRLFIFAATTVRYIYSKSQRRLPNTIIAELLKLKTPFLDQLYFSILDEAVPKDEPECVANYQKILGAILHLAEPLSAEALAGLLGLQMSDIVYTLQSLSSVVHSQAESKTVSIIHLSFREYVTGSITNQREDLVCREAIHHKSLALSTLQLMTKELRFNIIDFPSSYMCNADVTDLPERLNRNVSSQLAYSCNFWSFHLKDYVAEDKILDHVKYFIEMKLLYWLELCSLSGKISNAQHSLQRLLDWSKVCYCFAHA